MSESKFSESKHSESKSEVEVPSMTDKQSVLFKEMCAVDEFARFSEKQWWSSEDGLDKSGIYRFLLGHNWNVETAKKMLVNHIAWRKENIPVELTPDVRNELTKGKVYQEGYDKKGNPVFIIRIDRFDPKTRSLESSIKACTHLTEKFMSAVNGKHKKVTIMWSRVNANRGNMDLEFIKGLLANLSVNYPERVENIIVYPASKLFIGIWTMVSGWMAEKTRNKVKLAYNEAEILNWISKDQLTSRHGGTLVSEFDHDEYRVTELEDTSKIQELNVPAGKVIEEKMMVVAGSLVKYEFSLIDYDIDFSVAFKASEPGAEEQTIIAQKRVDSVGEAGSYETEKNGEYKMVVRDIYKAIVNECGNIGRLLEVCDPQVCYPLVFSILKEESGKEKLKECLGKLSLTEYENEIDVSLVMSFISQSLEALKATRMYDMLEMFSIELFGSEDFLSFLSKGSYGKRVHYLNFLMGIVCGYSHAPTLVNKITKHLISMMIDLNERIKSPAELSVDEKNFAQSYAKLIYCITTQHYQMQQTLSTVISNMLANKNIFPLINLKEIVETLKDNSWFRVREAFSFPWFEGVYESPVSKSQFKATSFVATLPCEGTLIKGGKEFRIEGLLTKNIPSDFDLKVDAETPWSFGGSQKLISSSSNSTSSQSSNDKTQLPWNCNSCTMVNPGSSIKCSACDAAAPSKVFQDKEGMNPTNSNFTLSSCGRVLYGYACRGDKVYSWIGIKECISYNINWDMKSHDKLVPFQLYEKQEKLPSFLYQIGSNLSLSGEISNTLENCLILGKNNTSFGSIWCNYKMPISQGFQSEIHFDGGKEWNLTFNILNCSFWEMNSFMNTPCIVSKSRITGDETSNQVTIQIHNSPTSCSVNINIGNKNSSRYLSQGVFSNITSDIIKLSLDYNHEDGYLNLVASTNGLTSATSPCISLISSVDIPSSISLERDLVWFGIQSSSGCEIKKLSWESKGEHKEDVVTLSPSSCLVCNSKKLAQAGSSNSKAERQSLPDDNSLPPLIGDEPNKWYCESCTLGQSSSNVKCEACAMPNNQIKIPAPQIEDLTGGDSWYCRSCTYANAKSLKACSICNTPSSSSDPVSRGIPIAPPAVPAQETKAPQPTIALPPREWSCPTCTFLNQPGAVKCDICQTDKVSTASNDSIASEEKKVEFLKETKEERKEETKEEKMEIEVDEEDLEDLFNNVIAKKFKSYVSQYPSSIQGTWDTSLGIAKLSLGNVESVKCGFLVEGKYEELATPTMTLTGIARILDNKWRISGDFYNAALSNKNVNYFQIDLTGKAKNIFGKWYKGDTSGEWEGVKMEDEDKFRLSKNMGYCGLVNMKDGLINVCYQNSLLQALFATKYLRDKIIQLPFQNAIDNESKLSASEYKSYNSPSVETAKNLLYNLRKMFIQLVASQRPEIATHIFQHCLPDNFSAGQQQDTLEFKTFIIETLKESFTLTNEPEVMNEIFGGVIAEVSTCTICNTRKVKEEPIIEQILVLPESFTPITAITAISHPRELGKTPKLQTPPGFHMIPVDLNQNRNNAPYTYLCVSREELLVKENELTRENCYYIDEIRIQNCDRDKNITNLGDGFIKVDVDLNGGSGDKVYLFYKRCNTGSPITNLQILVGDNPVVADGYTMIKTNLSSGGGGEKTYLSYRKDMCLTDISIPVNGGKSGYEMCGHSLLLNRGANDLNLYYTSGNGPPVTDLKLISKDRDDFYEAEKNDYKRVAVFNESYLMMRKGHGSPICNVQVYRAPDLVPRYSDYEIIDLYPDLASSSPSLKGQWESKDRTPANLLRSLTFNPRSATSTGFRFKGTFSKGESQQSGILEGVAVHTNVVNYLEMARYLIYGYYSESNNGPYHVSGFIRVTQTKVDFEFTSINTESVASKKTVIYGSRVNRNTSIEIHITDLMVIYDDARLPEGFEKLCELSVGGTNNKTIWLCAERCDGASVIDDICIIRKDIDIVPEGYIPVYQPNGEEANIASVDDGGTILMCMKKSTVDRPVDGIVAIQTFISDKDKLLPGYKKHSHMKGLSNLEAMLNPGNRFGKNTFVCSKRGPQSSKPVPHDMNGTYTSTWGDIKLHAVSEGVATEVTVMTNNKAAYTGLNQEVKGFLLTHTPPSLTSVEVVHEFFGTFSQTYNDLNVYWKFDAQFKKAEGHLTNGKDKKSLDIVKDNYVYIGFRRDFYTLWQKGVEIFTGRSKGFKISNLVDKWLERYLTDPKNEIDCSTCEKKVQMMKSNILTKPPQHLMVSIKRIIFEATLMKSSKNLQHVDISCYLELPSVPEDFVSTDLKTKIEPDRAYGLYAVVVHSGTSPNTGHYFAFTRGSECNELYLEDSPKMPWVRFNDSKVEIVNFKKLSEDIKGKVGDTAYVLFYKRLTPQNIASYKKLKRKEEENNKKPEEGKRKDVEVFSNTVETDEEALLRIAMELSMNDENVELETDNLKYLMKDDEILSQALELSRSTSFSPPPPPLSTILEEIKEKDISLDDENVLINEVLQANRDYIFKELSSQSSSMLSNTQFWRVTSKLKLSDEELEFK